LRSFAYFLFIEVKDVDVAESDGTASDEITTTTRGGYVPTGLWDPNNPEVPIGCIFSYMPLPIRCGLPVHINGSFAITSNRKYICQQNEDDKVYEWMNELKKVLKNKNDEVQMKAGHVIIYKVVRVVH